MLKFVFQVSWRCSVCRRRGVAIIARHVQPGIEDSEVLEGLGKFRIWIII